jgi:hypothetical protein
MSDAPSMKSFVVIFRQLPPDLSDAEKQRRAEETAVWARQQNDAGRQLNPHILDSEAAYLGYGNHVEPPDQSSRPTALLFLEAGDLKEAVAVAGSHPALRYRASVEVRPWARPAARQL